ncbi:MAG TPA: ribosome small subunit-dependent GTPase A [Anaerolineaceae bacterium]|nr:ribosome small subunit-dependent GTPase A [Anaerolineaceae bacterium]
MSKGTLSGWITRQQSGFYTVLTESGSVVCRLRGRLKKRTPGAIFGDIAAIGDQVQITAQADGSGSIERVEPRKQALVRMAPTRRGEYQQILLANADQVLLVFACAQPAPRLRMLDRLLVICEKESIPAVIIANKVDLVGLERAQELFSTYPPLGYPVIFSSVKTEIGFEAVRKQLIGKLSGLAGPSGVGKSSLLNTIQPKLGLAVREVSETTSKGKHTTNARAMFALDEGGFVADLPGLKSVGLWDTQPEELDGYFPELRTLVSQCQFSDCKHLREPGCAVRAAVEAGTVHPERYASYLRLRFGEERAAIGVSSPIADLGEDAIV